MARCLDAWLGEAKHYLPRQKLSDAGETRLLDKTLNVGCLYCTTAGSHLAAS